MKGDTLTDRQLMVFEAIIAASANGVTPSIRELADRTGIKSTNGVNDHLKALERKGFIERKPGLSRAIAILRYPPSSLRSITDAEALDRMSKALVIEGDPEAQVEAVRTLLRETGR